MHLVEVKYRTAFTDQDRMELYRQLEHQRRFWPQSGALLLIGQGEPLGGAFVQDYVRAIPPGKHDRLRCYGGIEQMEKSSQWSEAERWTDLPMAHKWLTSLAEENMFTLSDYLTRAIKALASL